MPTPEEGPLFARIFCLVDRRPEEPLSGRGSQNGRRLEGWRTIPYRLTREGVQGHAGVFEMTWAPDGAPPSLFGPDQISGEKQIIWRRVGGHEALQNP
jgi:hypothetical protein